MKQPLRIIFVGDIFPGDESFTIGFGIKSMTISCKKAWIQQFKEVIGDADLVIGNLESPILSQSNRKNKTFYGIPEFVDILKETGVSVVNLANNHILEHGEEGFRQTLHILRQKGIVPIGQTSNGHIRVEVIEKHGIRIAMASLCDERISAIQNEKHLYAPLSEENIVAMIDEFRHVDAELKIAMFHWGNEYVSFPSIEQQQIAHRLIDADVNLIVGHHSHCIQPYEKYRNGHIFYSLGNFCFDDLHSMLVKTGLIVTIQYDGIQMLPAFRGVRLHDMFESNLLVSPMHNPRFSKLFNRINSRYQQLLQISVADYETFYRKTVRQNRFKARIIMRTSLITKLLRTSLKKKKMMLCNLFSFLRDKLLSPKTA